MIKIISPLSEIKNKVLISACLLGINCRYDGKERMVPVLIELIEKKYFIPIAFCPEQLGGLSTPRNPSEISFVDENNIEKWKIIDNNNNDVQPNFYKGAIESLKIIKLNSAYYCLMKENSLSCGVNFIYDGTFSGYKISGMGITSFILKKNNHLTISSDVVDDHKKGFYAELFGGYSAESNDTINYLIKTKGGFVIE